MLLIIILLIVLFTEHPKRKQNNYTGTTLVLIYFGLPLLLMLPSTTQAQVQFTNTEHYTVSKDVKVLTLDIPSTATVEHTTIKGSRIIIEQVVTLSTANNVYQQLQKTNRYNLSMSIDATTRNMRLTQAQNKILISKKEGEIIETIKYRIYTPKEIERINKA